MFFTFFFFFESFMKVNIVFVHTNGLAGDLTGIVSSCRGQWLKPGSDATVAQL